MKRVWLALAVFAGFLVMPVVATSASAAAPTCNWGVEYSRTLAELHEDPKLWSVGSTPDGLWGEAGDGGAVVNPSAKCAYVADVVRHEHMHLQQVRVWGSWAEVVSRYGDRVEITADCASQLAGSRYAPYAQRAGGCSLADIEDAKLIISGIHHEEEKS